MGKLDKGRGKLQDRVEKQPESEGRIKNRAGVVRLLKGMAFFTIGVVVVGGVLFPRRNG